MAYFWISPVGCVCFHSTMVSRYGVVFTLDGEIFSFRSVDNENDRFVKHFTGNYIFARITNEDFFNLINSNIYCFVLFNVMYNMIF